MTLTRIACYVVLSLAVGQAWGAPIFIDVGEDCSKTVVDSTGRACEEGAACRHRGETVNWIVRPGNHDFEVSFHSESPFGDDTACLTQTGQPCQIPETTEDGAYDYDVRVDIPGCGWMDPRILVN